MIADKVLQRMELENRKELLKGVEEQAINDELYIKNSRGIYNIGFRGTINIIIDIQGEIRDINKQLEELTGLNPNHMEKLNGVGL